jgi:hypothetical protein
LDEKKELNPLLMAAIKIMGIVQETDIDPEFLYSDLISEKMNVEDHYEAYIVNPIAFSFLKYPYILNPASKLDVIRHENRLIQFDAVRLQKKPKWWEKIVSMFRPTDRPDVERTLHDPSPEVPFDERRDCRDLASQR